MDPAAVVAGPLQDAAQCGYQAAVLVGNHQLGAVQAAFLQGAQEAAPKHLILGVAHIDAQDFPAAGGGDSGGDYDSQAGDLPAGAGAADVQVGGVEEQIRKRGVVQGPAAERRHGLVQPSKIRDTSDFEMPESMPSAVTRSSTARVETPLT